MERRKDYEPIILDLQKSQRIHQPKIYLYVFIISAVMFGSLLVFAALYFQRPFTQNSRGQMPEQPQSIVTEAAPSPLPTEVPPTPVPQPTETPSVAQTGWLTLHSVPENAEVIINGNVLGHTPLDRYELPEGTYPITFSYDGHRAEHTLKIHAGETTEFTYRFPGFAALDIDTTTSGSEIYLNGKFAGESPVKIGGLSPGTYTITVKKIGYATTERTVTLAKGETEELFITIRRLDSVSPSAEEPTPTPRRPIHPSERLRRSTPTP